MSSMFAFADHISAIMKPLSATLDDIAGSATITSAAKASKKASAVIIDDFAVAPKYVADRSEDRELPMILKIARGSLINKAILVPVSLLLSAFLPFLIVPLLCIGGLYLATEGVLKSIEIASGSHHDKEKMDEDATVSSAVKTDFILSAEILIIALSVIGESSLLQQAAILVIVGVFVTVFVYGCVAIIVRLDDWGLRLTSIKYLRWLGLALVKSVPILLKLLALIGTLAMLSVGGSILEHTLHHYHLDLIHNLYSAIENALLAIPSGLVEFFLNIVLGFFVGAPFAVFLNNKN